MTEIWKDIGGYREKYQISNYGRARTIDRNGSRSNKVSGHLLTPHKNSSGYLRYGMNLTGKPKEFFVHRLVAEAFIPNPDHLPVVNHMDGNKNNNHVDNLEWCTRSQNERHAWSIGLKKATPLRGEKHGGRIFSQKDIEQIRKEYIYRDKNYGQCALARKYHTSQSHIWGIVHNRNWINEEEPNG